MLEFFTGYHLLLSMMSHLGFRFFRFLKFPAGALILYIQKNYRLLAFLSKISVITSTFPPDFLQSLQYL